MVFPVVAGGYLEENRRFATVMIKRARRSSGLGFVGGLGVRVRPYLRGRHCAALRADPYVRADYLPRPPALLKRPTEGPLEQGGWAGITPGRRSRYEARNERSVGDVGRAGLNRRPPTQQQPSPRSQDRR